MNNVKRDMINEFRLKKLGMDFMGYKFNREGSSFHHLIVPRRNCKEMGLGKGIERWNGAILMQSLDNSPHDYLHTIEKYDYERFLEITSELIEQNLLGRLDKECLIRIHDILKSFENEYQNERNKNGTLIVRDEFIRKRTLLK